MKSELHSLEDAAAAHNAFLRVADNLENFLLQLSKAADTMSVTERQKVLRLVVKEILVDDDTIKIKHSIPFTRSSTPGESKVGPQLPGYLLRSRRHHPSLRNTPLAAGFQNQLQQSHHFVIVDPFGHLLQQEYHAERCQNRPLGLNR